MHVSEYLLPGLLKVHPKCPVAICSEIRTLAIGDELAADLRSNAEAWTGKELQYFGLVHVCLQARLSALPTGCELQSNSVYLSRNEMKIACLSGHSDLRLTALNALVASSKTTQLPPAGTKRCKRCPQPNLFFSSFFNNNSVCTLVYPQMNCLSFRRCSHTA